MNKENQHVWNITGSAALQRFIYYYFKLKLSFIFLKNIALISVLYFVINMFDIQSYYPTISIPSKTPSSLKSKYIGTPS